MPLIILIGIVCSISEHMSDAMTFKSLLNTTMSRGINRNKKDKCDVCVAHQDYCDSNWLPYNNLNAGLRGIDLPKKSPSPMPLKADPSSRNLIFNSVIRNEDFGHMELLSYISVTESLKCVAAFESESFTTLEQYVREASYSSLADWDLGFSNPETSFYGSSLLSIPPNSFNINLGSQNMETNRDLEYFFNRERGSISRSSARCSVYRMEVDINDPNLQLTSSFESAIRKLDSVLQG